MSSSENNTFQTNLHITPSNQHYDKIALPWEEHNGSMDKSSACKHRDPTWQVVNAQAAPLPICLLACGVGHGGQMEREPSR